MADQAEASRAPGRVVVLAARSMAVCGKRRMVLKFWAKRTRTRNEGKDCVWQLNDD